MINLPLTPISVFQYTSQVTCTICRGLTKVVNSRNPDGKSTKRTRQCVSCGRRFTTAEIIVKSTPREHLKKFSIKTSTIHITDNSALVAESALSDMSIAEIGKELDISKQGVHYIIRSFQRKDDEFYRELRAAAIRTNSPKLKKRAEQTITALAESIPADIKLFEECYNKGYRSTVGIIRKLSWKASDDRLDPESLASSSWAMAWQHWTELQQEPYETIISHIVLLAKRMAFPQINKNSKTSSIEEFAHYGVSPSGDKVFVKGSLD